MKIVCISGKAQHGKDTTAALMKEELEKTGARVLIAHYADLLKYICRQFFGWNGKKDEAGRQLLQYVGTDVVRKQAPNYWVDFLIGILKLFDGDWDYVLIPDCRFPNEIEAMRENGFDTTALRVVRDNFDNGLTNAQKNHPSETALDDYRFDVVVPNNGSVEHLRELLIYCIKRVQNHG